MLAAGVVVNVYVSPWVVVILLGTLKEVIETLPVTLTLGAETVRENAFEALWGVGEQLSVA